MISFSVCGSRAGRAAFGIRVIMSFITRYNKTAEKCFGRPQREEPAFSRMKDLRKIGGEVMFEIDSLYVSTEMILSRRFREHPLDGLLLEACLLHFRVVWDFFYRLPKKKPSDVESSDIVVQDYAPTWTAALHWLR